MDFLPLIQFILYVVLSLFFGLYAMYFWVKIYNDVQKGSIAWLLLALTSVFLIASSILPAIAIAHADSGADLNGIILVLLSFFSCVYTGTFAAAGFLVFRAFKTIPKEDIGEYLMEGMVFKVPESDEVSGLLGNSTLLEYTTQSRYEDGVIELVLRMYGELRNVILVSTEPRTSIYREKLEDLVDVGAMKFIEISTGVTEITTEDEVIRVPITELNQFLDLFDQLPPGVRVIFEPLSHLILRQGPEETYKLVSSMAEKFSHKNLDIVAMINRDAHDEKVVSQFKGLFVTHAELTSDKIKVKKGKKEEYIRYMVGEKFFLEAQV